jgi:hypothetical protein
MSKLYGPLFITWDAEAGYYAVSECDYRPYGRFLDYCTTLRSARRRVRKLAKMEGPKYTRIEHPCS